MEALFWLILFYHMEFVHNDCTDSPIQMCPCDIRSPAGSNDVIADCVHKNLSHVPHLPSNVTIIKMNNNSIQKIQNGDFKECTHVTTLDLSCNNITLIEREALMDLVNLLSLNLSYNVYFLFNGGKLFKIPVNVNKLTLQRVVHRFYIHNYELSELFFIGVKDSNLTALSLDGNGIYKVPPNMAQYLPKLQKLSLTFNRFGYYKQDIHLNPFQFLSSLKELDISNQDNFLFFNDIKPDREFNLTILLPNQIKVFHFASTFYSPHASIRDIVILTNSSFLSLIDLSGNKMNKIKISMIFYPPKSRHLETLNLSRCSIEKISGTFVRHSNIILDTLDLSHNNLGQTIRFDYEGSLLKHLEEMRLKHLDLSNNNIRFLSPWVFQNATYLQRIILRDNSLQLTFDMKLNNLKYLSVLDLSLNAINDVSHNFRNQLKDIYKKQSKPFFLDISENPFFFDCDHVEILNWFLENENMLSNTAKYYIFETYRNLSQMRINFTDLPYRLPSLESRCVNRMWVIWTSIIMAFLILVLSVSVCVFRHRWDIRYLCLQLTRQRKRYQYITDNQESGYDYDAFISYHKDDVQWVKNELLVFLENPPNRLRLCIHQRDWLPGPTIEENVTTSISNSRKTIAVLTKSFIKSQWCDFEIQMARLRGFDEGQEIIIVIALEEIPATELSTTLTNLRRRNTWLEYPQDLAERDNFWQLLKNALAHPSDLPMRCECGATYLSMRSQSTSGE